MLSTVKCNKEGFCQKIECVLYQIPQTVAVKGTSLLEQLHQPLRIERFN